MLRTSRLTLSDASRSAFASCRVTPGPNLTTTSSVSFITSRPSDVLLSTRARSEPCRWQYCIISASRSAERSIEGLGSGVEAEMSSRKMPITREIVRWSVNWFSANSLDVASRRVAGSIRLSVAWIIACASQQLLIPSDQHLKLPSLCLLVLLTPCGMVDPSQKSSTYSTSMIQAPTRSRHAETPHSAKP